MNKIPGAARIGLFGMTCLFLAFLVAAPPQKKQVNDHELLYANPLLFRALSGPFHTLVADWLWLLSSEVGEIRNRYETIDSESFFKASKTITVMDPHFILAINYGALFLASVQNKPQKAQELLKTGLYFNEHSFILRYLLLTIYINYYEKEERNIEEIVRLAKEAYTLPDSDNFIRKELSSKDFIQDILVFARRESDSLEQAKADLRWLLERTEDEARKAAIKARLEQVEKEIRASREDKAPSD